jgi:hypothetical protein
LSRFSSVSSEAKKLDVRYEGRLGEVILHSDQGVGGRVGRGGLLQRVAIGVVDIGRNGGILPQLGNGLLGHDDILHAREKPESFLIVVESLQKGVEIIRDARGRGNIEAGDVHGGELILQQVVPEQRIVGRHADPDGIALAAERFQKRIARGQFLQRDRLDELVATQPSCTTASAAMASARVSGT